MSRLRLDDRIFVPVINSENGTVNGNTRFHFWQNSKGFFADYVGGDVAEGHIIGRMTGEMTGQMVYHCLTIDNTLKAGEAKASFITLDDERLAIDIDWQWLTGDKSSGRSRYEEIK